MNNLQSVKLGELLISLRTGLNPRDNFVLNTHDAVNWYITVRELNGLGVDFLSQTDKVNNHGLKLINNRSNLEIGDVLFSGTGTIGKTAIIDEYPTNWNIKEGVYSLKPKKDRLESYYLMYLLKHLNKLNVFNKISAGSTVFSVPMRSLEDIMLHIHKLPEQIKISKVLKELDFKIELNNRINAELEAMAKTIYDYWFVQFDFPYDFAKGRPDKNGQPYKRSGGKMVWNEELKREVPEGWEVKPINSKVTIGSGFPFNSDDYSLEGIFKIITIKNVQDGYLDTSSVECISALPKNISSFCILKEGDILMSLTGNVGRMCFVDRGNLLLNQRVGKLLGDSDFVDYIYFFFKRPENQVRLANLAGGSSQANLSPIDAVKDKFLIPAQSVLNEFANTFRPIKAQILNKNRENQQLASLRDWLLPMLMNGQVRVR